jgi:hypothetical protein
MFCIACGRQMNDEERFCSQCGTRRAVIPTDTDTPRIPAPVRAEQPASVPTPASVRPIRSTAEIMPMRVPRPAAPPPVEAAPPPLDSAVHWPEERVAPPSLFTTPGPAAYSEPEPVRQAAPAYADAPARAAENPVVTHYGSVPFAAAPGSAEVTGRRSKISPVLIGAVIVALLAVGGIVWMLRSSMSANAKPTPVEITMFPTTAKVAAGKGVDFAATVTGAPTSEVTWKVEEGDNAGQIQTRGAYAKEGAISLYSTYTAPKTPGTYHLVATSTADTSKSASAEITVTAK